MKKEKFIVTLLAVAGFISQAAFAQNAGRPSQRLAEGESCDDETPPTTSSPTPSPSDCECVCPTPTECEPETPPEEKTCKYYKFSLNNVSGKDDRIAGGGRSLKDSDIFKYDEATEGLSCLTTALNDIKNKCNSKGYKSGGYHDDCIAIGVTKKFFSEQGLDSQCSSWDNKSHVGKHVFGSRKHCLHGSFYFDENCSPVTDVDANNLCGNANVNFIWSCPISLLWENDHDINGHQTLTNFKLDSNNNNSWTTWKASDKAPLLVYDPEHKGIVTDASQLFGNWTFGGKRTAALSNTSTTSKWENGYEALATLDRDHNGKVDGSELNDLALWFDTNRNGVSEAGEVRSVSDMGISALYYKGYKKDVFSKDLRLEIGYERNVDGHTVQGVSIDWYGKTAKTKADLASFADYAKDGFSVKDAPVLAENVNIPNKFSGTWKLYLEEDSTRTGVSDGLFVLSEENGAVKGYSFVEKLYNANSGLNSAGSVSRVIGTHTTKFNRDTLNFSVQAGKMTLNNEATLSSDGRQLRGKTSAVTANGVELVSYTWKAIRAE